jgi:hypothetical protein
MQQRLVLLDHRDVMGFLLPCQPAQVRPHRVQSVEGHHGTGQVQGFQELGEVAGLVMLDVDRKVIQETAAVEMAPGAVGATGAAGGLPVHGHCP